MNDLDTFPRSLADVFSTGTVLSESGETLPLDSNVSLIEAVALHRAVKENHCQSTAEVGLAKGISATAIVSAIAGHPGAMHHAMDPYQTNYGNAGLRMLRDSGLSPHFRHYSQYAEEVFPSLPALDFFSLMPLTCSITQWWSSSWQTRNSKSEA